MKSTSTADPLQCQHASVQPKAGTETEVEHTVDSHTEVEDTSSVAESAQDHLQVTMPVTMEVMFPTTRCTKVTQITMGPPTTAFQCLA